MTKKNSIRGKKSRAAGGRFELKARKDLEKDGWVVSKWQNNVEDGELIPAKRKFNPFLKILGLGTGFPDFIAFKTKKGLYDVIGVEVKANGWLDREEKEKCKFLLEKKIFSRILIAKKSKERGKIDYVNFKDKYGL